MELNDPLLKSLLGDEETAPKATESADEEEKMLLREFKEAKDDEAGLVALRQLIRKLK
jgi:hypothetical protein